MHILMVAAASVAALAASIPAQAEPTASEMLAKIDDGTDHGIYISFLAGIGSGYLWANVELARRGLAPLFCQPTKLTITADESVQIVRQYVLEDPKRGEFPAGLVELKALQATFPCKP